MQLTPEQLAERRSGIGASNAAAACGLSKYQTPYGLWRFMQGLDEPSNGELLHLEMGNHLEPFTINRFERQQKVTVVDRQLKVVDPNYSWRWVTLDGRVQQDRALVEAKSVGFADPAEWGDEMTDDAVPMEHYAQCQHGLSIVTDAPYTWLPVIVLNRQFRIYRIRRDEEVIAKMISLQNEFMMNVKLKKAPPPETVDDVKLMWPADTGKRLNATPEIAKVVADLKLSKSHIKDAEEAQDELKLAIATFMGDHAELVHAGKVICTYKKARDGHKFDVNRFMVDHPAMYDRYLIPVQGSRRMLTK